MSFIHRFTSRPILIFGLVSFIVVGTIVILSRPAQVTQAQPPVIGGCQIFPADNVWNVPITNLPVDPNSATYINTIGATRGMHPDFGSGGDVPGVMYGIPFVTVPSTQPKVPVTFDVADESDPGPYPIPQPPTDSLIEGGLNSTGDRHVIVVQKGTCKLYETYSSYPQNNGASWTAYSGAIYDLNSNALRTDTWTSADAAGLPILPGLANYDEYVATGSINHALRFTVQCANGKVWPATHLTTNCSAGHAPMGQRFRLKASYVIPSNYSPQTKAILQALKTYGMIVADNGSNWFISGQPNAGWDDDNLVPELSAVKGSNFEAVDSSSLMVDLTSGRAAVPPTSAPGGLAVAVGSTSQLNLSWTNTAPNTTGYYIERSLSPSSGFSQIGSTLVGAPLYPNTGLTEGTTYYYRVRAYNPYGNSAYSSVVSKTTLPNAPTLLPATAASFNQINLSWNDNSNGESGYSIERALAIGGPYAVVGTTGSNVSTYQDKGLLENTTYYYQVRAFNSGGNSAYSNQVNDLTPLAPPTNLLVWAFAFNQIKLQWVDKSQIEDGYVVERSPDGTTAWAQVGSTTAANATTFTNTGLAVDTQYFYRVKAKKASVYSVFTSIVSATTTVWHVTALTDDGTGNISSSLSSYLNSGNVSAGQTIFFDNNVAITAVNWNPTIPVGITLVGNLGCGSPTFTIDGINALAGSNGLVLNQTTLINLKITRFPNVQIKNSGTGNKLVCTQAVK